jgi:hypothetical protein
MQGVSFPACEAELAGALVEIDGGALTRMNASEIDGQPAVDEDPHIVVALKSKDLAADVLEDRRGLEREMEVVGARLVAEQQAVDRKELPIVVDEQRRVRGRGGKVEGDRRGDVHSLDIAVPLIEVLSTRRGPHCAAAVHGFVVFTEGLGDDARFRLISCER